MDEEFNNSIRLGVFVMILVLFAMPLSFYLLFTVKEKPKPKDGLNEWVERMLGLQQIQNKPKKTWRGCLTRGLDDPFSIFQGDQHLKVPAALVLLSGSMALCLPMLVVLNVYVPETQIWIRAIFISTLFILLPLSVLFAESPSTKCKSNLATLVCIHCLYALIYYFPPFMNLPFLSLSLPFFFLPKLKINKWIKILLFFSLHLVEVFEIIMFVLLQVWVSIRLLQWKIQSVLWVVVQIGIFVWIFGQMPSILEVVYQKSNLMKATKFVFWVIMFWMT